MDETKILFDFSSFLSDFKINRMVQKLTTKHMEKLIVHLKERNVLKDGRILGSSDKCAKQDNFFGNLRFMTLLVCKHGAATDGADVCPAGH